MYYRADGLCEKENYAFSYMTTLKYLENKIEGKDTSSFFLKYNFNSIAIYGLGVKANFGKLLYLDILNTGVEVKYFIDKQPHLYKNEMLGIPVIGLNDLQYQEPVDIIVITPVFHCNVIIDDLSNAGIDIRKTISLTDIVFSL